MTEETPKEQPEGPPEKPRRQKKTPEQQLAELNEKQAKIEAQLKQKREAIIRKKRQQLAKLTNQKRKEDTRRKVLDGALLQHMLSTGKANSDVIDKVRDAFLERDDDRALFGLPPRPAASDSGEKPDQPAPYTVRSNDSQ